MRSWVLGGLPYPSEHSLFFYCKGYLSYTEKRPQCCDLFIQRVKTFNPHNSKVVWSLDEVSQSICTGQWPHPVRKVCRGFEDVTFLFIDLTWLHPLDKFVTGHMTTTFVCTALFSTLLVPQEKHQLQHSCTEATASFRVADTVTAGLSLQSSFCKNPNRSDVLGYPFEVLATTFTPSLLIRPFKLDKLFVGPDWPKKKLLHQKN